MTIWGLALATLLLAGPAAADLVLPPGFAAETYATGEGFDPSTERGIRGLPATSTLGFDRAGTLYLARSGARFRVGEADELLPLYRIPAGGATLTPGSEARYLYGPPLPNPQIGLVRPDGTVYVTTFDRDRKLGALYRLQDRRITLVAGGTPPDGELPLLRQPDGVAIDPAGRIYVADRAGGRVVRLAPDGRILDRAFLTVGRPRTLLADEQGHLWIGSDGTAELPWQDGAGRVLRADAEGRTAVVLEGPLPAGMSLSPAGALFVAQRRTGQIFVLAGDGRRIDFARTTDGGAVRALAFAPVSEATRRAGMAGDLFVVVVRRYVWPINEVVRVSGPFDAFARERLPSPAP